MAEEEKKEEKKPEKKKPAAKGGKKPHKNKPTSKKYTKYHIDGEIITKDRFCPRCGPGVFLMKASNRLYCGRCHYTEFFGKSEEKIEEKPEEEKKVE